MLSRFAIPRESCSNSPTISGNRIAAAERLPRGCTMDSNTCALTDVQGRHPWRAIQTPSGSSPGARPCCLWGATRVRVEEIVSAGQSRRRSHLCARRFWGGDGSRDTRERRGGSRFRSVLLAEKTGGRRLLSTVGFELTTSFNQMIEDLSGYYLLGYRPSGDDARIAETLGPPQNRSGGTECCLDLKARFRDGLHGFARSSTRCQTGGSSVPSDSAPVSPVNPAAGPPERQAILSKALFSVFTQDGVRIHLSPLFAASKPDRKKKRSPFVRALVDIDGRDVVFADVDGGKDGGKKKAGAGCCSRWCSMRKATQVGAANKAFTLLASKEKAADLAAKGERPIHPRRASVETRAISSARWWCATRPPANSGPRMRSSIFRISISRRSRFRAWS